jgi:hypothetical protein
MHIVKLILTAQAPVIVPSVSTQLAIVHKMKLVYSLVTHTDHWWDAGQRLISEVVGCIGGLVFDCWIHQEVSYPLHLFAGLGLRAVAARSTRTPGCSTVPPALALPRRRCQWNGPGHLSIFVLALGVRHDTDGQCRA